VTDDETHAAIVDATERALEHSSGEPGAVELLPKVMDDVPDDVSAEEAAAVVETVLDGDSDRTPIADESPSPATNGHSAADSVQSDGAGAGTDAAAATGEAVLDRGAIREYYRQVADAVAPLGDLAGNPTMLINDKVGWYVTRENTDPSDDEVGRYEKKRRARDFTNDYDHVVEERLDRTLYALTSYKQPAAFERWEAATYDDEAGGYNYLNEKPSPGTEDIAAIAAWGDIDLADDLKAQRPDLDADIYATAEAALDAYVDAFAELYGGRDAVYMIDSVGGAYIFGAPEATLPIARHFKDDTDARTRIIEAFIDRSNEYLQDAEERVNDSVDGASEVVHPDWANNINRQYKMPLAIHGDHDAVVTPVDVNDITYREPTPVHKVDGDLLDETQAWCEALTNGDYQDRVDELVATLWPDEYDEADDWKAALEAWVETEREAEREERKQREAARQRRESRLAELGGGLEGTPITPFMQDVYDALDNIDTGDVIRQYACDGWDTGTDESQKTEFDPSWRTSSSGSSCYVDHQQNTFGDPGCGGGGYAAKAMALGKGIIGPSDTAAAQTLSGQEWAAAVDELRDAGCDVPVWTPEAGSAKRDGSTYEQMPLWALRKAAVALGVLPEEAFIEREGEDGGTYLGFPGQETYNNALEAVEDAGLEHGREYADTGPDYPTYELFDADTDPDIELHLVPLNGKEARIEIHQNDQREYIETQERGFWHSGTKRGRIAGRVVDEVTGVGEKALRDAVKDALSRVALDSEAEWFDDAMRSAREQRLRDRTERVVCYPGADDAEWLVTMQSTPTSDETEAQTITFDAGQMHNADPGHFQKLHLAVFLEKIDIDSAEWANLTDYWLTVQETKDREADTRLEAAIEEFTSAIGNLRVWGEEEGFNWDGSTGYYVEDFTDDGDDAILVPGRWVESWKHDNDYSEINLSKELRQRDIALRSSCKRTLNSARRMVWPINAEKTDWSPETALTVPDEDDEDGGEGAQKPEGLR
jgi:hypothetical protein